MRINHILWAATIFMVASCKKSLTLEPVSFGVTADSASYTRGSLTTFKFTGNPDNITFYSGSWGMRYQYANRLSDTSGTDMLNFSTTVNTAGTDGVLSLFYSTDFANDTSQVVNATWTDVSTISPIAWAATATAVASGPIDLTSLKSAGKPIYLAFKYTAAAGVTQKKWTISSLSLVHRPTGDTSYTILNASVTIPAYTVGTPPLGASPGWVAVNKSRNPTTAQLWSPLVSATSTSTLVITGATTAATAIASEQWMIAGPIDLTRVLRDVPTAVVKNIASLRADALAPPQTFRYALPGTYNATFVGINANANAIDSLAKTVQVVVN